MDETRLAVHPAGTSGGDSGLLRVRHFEEPNFTMKSYQNREIEKSLSMTLT
jgi:hypothetical protein